MIYDYWIVIIFLIKNNIKMNIGIIYRTNFYEFELRYISKFEIKYFYKLKEFIEQMVSVLNT